ncbi:hypothetical protein ACIQPS_33345 [Streptomyces sp. NPDC091290]|uniref:hypothetical protein n=1 Tax=Streptomyces sp. NPDC091290 TaxID=3365990 RepID=UPI00380AC8B6
MGAQVADTVLSLLGGAAARDPQPVVRGAVHSLGRSTGIFQIGNMSDEAAGLHIDSRFGEKLNEGLCKSIRKHLAVEVPKPGAYKFHKMEGGVGSRRTLEVMKAKAPAVGWVA